MISKKILGVIGAIMILALALTACEEPLKPAKNETVEQGPAGPVAEQGDLVEIEYTMRLMNGTVVDTTDGELAKEAELTSYKIGSQKIILGQSGKVKGFDEAIEGIELGSTETVVIPPSEPVMEMKINKTKKMHRFQPLNRKQAFKRSNFQEIFGKIPAMNDVVFNFDRFPWKYRIINISEQYVIGEMAVKQEERYTLPGMPWESSVFEVYTDVVTFFHDPKENQTIQTEFGNATVTTTGKSVFINYEPAKGQVLTKSMSVGGVTATKEFKIVEVTDKDFTIRRIGILEDKALELEVTVKDLTKNVKEIKPNRVREKITPVEQ